MHLARREVSLGKLMRGVTAAMAADLCLAMSRWAEDPMTLTTEMLASYLGREASDLLADLPFRNWTVKRTVDTDLEKPRIDYVFTHNGMDFVCDEEDNVSCIFFFSDESRCFNEGIQDLPFALSRREVLARYGSPAKSGGISIGILGAFGPWDRFARGNYSIHVHFHMEVDRIKLVTLMRADIVPS